MTTPTAEGLPPNATRVFDHGYVRLVETWGQGDTTLAEAGIIEAARMSTQGTFRGWEREGKLLQYLYDHRHDSPFEFAGMTIEVQAPLFVFREWHRHRTQSYNEASARYTELPARDFVPSLERCQQGGGTNKQAQGVGERVATPTAAFNWLLMLERSYAVAQQAYEYGLQVGIPKELARLSLPVGRYSKMRASANLRNWLGFLTLRTAPEAQVEMQGYAAAVATLVQQQFPRTHALWVGGR